MAKTKYGKYIITKPKPLAPPTSSGAPAGPPPGASKRVTYLDGDILKGAFYVECAWCLKGSGNAAAPAHTHDFDEVIAFSGTNIEDPSDLCGEIEFWLGDEKHLLTKSCLLFVPKGLKHGPMIVRRVDRPIFHFATGLGGTYEMKNK